MNERRVIVVQRLSEHFAADRISLDELERRLDLVYQAASPGDLAALTADLPTITSPVGPTSLGVATGSAGPGRRATISRRIRTVLGNIERSGPIDVPAYLEVRAVLGNIELDLRDAAFGPVTEIAIRAVLGNVEITLPAGVRVENDGDGFLGSFECHVSPGSVPIGITAPIVRLTGRTILGNVEVHAEPPDPSVMAQQHAALGHPATGP